MSNKENMAEDVQKGDYGEACFTRHYNKLVSPSLFGSQSLFRVPAMKIQQDLFREADELDELANQSEYGDLWREVANDTRKEAKAARMHGGKDGTVISMSIPENQELVKFTAGRYGDRYGFRVEPKRVVYEVKADDQRKFLMRDNNNFNAHGTIDIELYSNRNKKYKGWIYGYRHPAEYTKEVQARGCGTTYFKPDILAYMLMTAPILSPEEDEDPYARFGDEQCMPYAAIVFEDFKALYERLNKLAEQKFGWTLEKWDMPKATDPRWNEWEKRGDMMYNMWYVPLDEVADLATVTMIGDTEKLKENLTYKPKVPISLQLERLEYLEKLAKGRHADIDSEYVNDILTVIEINEGEKKAKKNQNQRQSDY